MKKLLIPALAVTMLNVASAQAEDQAPTVDLELAKSKAIICVACHGADGNGVPGQGVWPKLAGQHAEYLGKQLMEFKSGARKNDLMSPQAAGLNEQDMVSLAAYFAQMEQKAGTTDPAAAELGERVYRAGNASSGVPACNGCHGPAGMGLGLAKFPRIAGQNADYVAQSLQNFAAATRANDPNGMMRGVAVRMTEAEIAAVAQYVQGLTQ